jgi:hypothetical protein
MQITSLFLIIISATAAVSQTLIKVGPNDDSPGMTYYDTVVRLNSFFFNSSFSNISPGFDRVNAHGKAKYRNQLSLQLFNKKYEKFCLELPVRIQRSLSDRDISKTISDAMWNSAVSSYRVTNGCCSFYDDKSCESHLFTADTRQHW